MKVKRYLQLIRFDKPIGTLLLLWPTLWAIFIASGGRASFFIVFIFSLEVFLARSLGCIINDYFDADFDRHVTRTKNRPLAVGSISKAEAIWVFIFFGIVTFAIAIASLKLPTIIMSIPALLILFSYPLMKRFFAVPQLYLGIAFSFGILMAYIEILGKLNLLSWILFIANLLWVLGYDTIYALVDKEDDLKINIRTSAITFGGNVTALVFSCYCLMVGLLIYLGVLCAFHFWYWICLGIATVLLGYQVFVLQQQKRDLYFKMFLLNNRVGMLILLGIVLNYWW